jgi:formylglycine-generating enzyme required for sulfatase activity
MGKNPSHFCHSGEGKADVKGEDTRNFPVENVSWDDAVTFCKTLSAEEEEKTAKREYRLPTEAEWEYTCRAGTSTPFAFGDTLSAKQANFNGNFGRTREVGIGEPNAWGLYDMHGNVAEWCSDWHNPGYYGVSPLMDPKGPKNGTLRVRRGGPWSDGGRYCRSAIRTQDKPTTRSYMIGFRVVMEQR